MASEQLIKEELQNSVAVPAPDASLSYDDDASTGALERAAQLGVTNGIKTESAPSAEDNEADAEGEDEEQEVDDESQDNEEEEEEEEDDDDDDDDAFESATAGEDEDEDEEEDDEVETVKVSEPSHREPRIKNEEDEEEDEEDEDEQEEDGGEGEEEEGGEESSEEEDDGEEDEDTVDNAEGVGAVKIRPGETDDDDEESEASAEEAEEPESSDEEWEENAEIDDDDDEDEDEDGAESQTCTFCKQPEKNGPSGETSEFLTCSRCGENAHAACATEQGHSPQADETWTCSECREDKDEESPAIGDAMEVDAGERTSLNGVSSAPNHPESEAPKDATVSIASKPVEDQSEAGTRTLRKRKNSPNAEADETRMSLRKRRRNTTDDLSIDGFGSSKESTVPSSARSLRIKPPASLVSVVKKTKSSLILKMKVSGAELTRIFTKRRKYNKKSTLKVEKTPRGTGRANTARSAPHVAATSGSTGNIMPLMPSAYNLPFYSFYDKETDEQKGKPYGGILAEAEADTSKTFPTAEDRKRFDEAKENAEEEWRARLIQSEIEQQQPQKKSKKAAGPASQIECIEFGGWEIDTWYAAPYPEEYSRNRVLYICEFCLKYMNSDYVAWRHKLKCPAKHPPGDEIYRSRSVSFFEVDGRKNPVYCQNLCLLAKLFLGSKTLYYDVEPFLFYVLCEYDEFGYHFVGYFSKEKRASSQNNVSCILTLPIHQRKGYGNLLIDFSYLLTRVEKKTGSPEKPLSDMGLVSYRNYWRLVMCRYLLNTMAENKTEKFGLSIKQISDDTGMTADDVIAALEGLRCLVRDPQTGLYAFRVDLAYCREYAAKWEAKNHVTLDPEALTWTPYVMGRGNATNFELGPALTAIAPREEEDDDEPKPDDELAGAAATLPNGAGSTENAQTGANGAGNGEGKPAEDPVGTVLESTEPNDRDAASSAHDNDVTPATKTEDEADGINHTDHAAPASAQLGETGPSTNGNEVAHTGADVTKDGEEGKTEQPEDGEEKITDNPKCQGDAETSVSATTSSMADWTAVYDDIPPTRFVVYPPISARRFNYARAAIGRPPGSRTGSGVRGRARYGSASGSGSGSASRTPGAATGSARPKASGSSGRKKSGGTGRGPGRWPKGTKKSDYGNADSGPGLPPSWLSSRVGEDGSEIQEAGFVLPDAQPNGDGGGQLATSSANPQHGDICHEHEEIVEHNPKQEDDEPAAEDTVQVHTPTTATSTAKLLTDKRNGVNASAFESPKGRSSPRLGKGKETQAETEDAVMVDIDAEGEDE